MTLVEIRTAVDAGNRVHEPFRWKRIFGLKPVSWSSNVGQTVETLKNLYWAAYGKSENCKV